MKFFNILLLSTLAVAYVYAQDDDEEDVVEEVEIEPEAEVEEDVPEDPMDAIKAKEAETGIVDPINYPGRLISRKKLISEHPAAGQPLVFEYTLWNVGNSDVVDIEVNDEAFIGDEWIDGTKISFKVDKIAAGKSHKEEFTVFAKEEGEIKIGHAKVTYKSSTSNDNTELTQYSSDGASEGMVKLASAAFYARNVASHYFDWICFALLAMPSTLVPFVNANNIVERYSTKAKSS